MTDLFAEPIRYEPDETTEVLATALILQQSYGQDGMTGMSPTMWVDEAVGFRKAVQAAGNALYNVIDGKVEP